MRIIILASFMIVSSGTVHAAVYKCESDSGVSYQDTPCIGYQASKKIAISAIDPKLVKQARLKLEKELKEREKLEQQRAESQTKERILRALELKARAEQDLVYETRMQTYAINDNTQAVKRNTRNRYLGGVIYRSY
jgi:hypothetical protein